VTVYTAVMEPSTADIAHDPLESLSLLFETDRDISLELHLPEDERLQENGERTIIASASKASFKARCHPIWLPLTAWIGSAVFTILYSLFIYRVLIQSDPKIGSCVFDASLTNLLLSIFSQLYTMLLLFMVQGLLDALRWSLTMRAGRAGTSASNFFQLSPATDWLSVLSLIFHSRLRSLWGVFR
jgi:hypothetical protein